MSSLNRKQLKKLILKEFKMMGMAPMHGIGGPPMGMSAHSMDDHGHDSEMAHSASGEMMVHSGHKGVVSKEDCCKAVLCLIECCECPDTKQLIKECCEDILSRC